ncbi:MAG: hypothetical protein QM695_01035 [Micropruina sp.]
MWCADANRRLCNQAFFTAIFIDDDGEPRVTCQRPYDTLCDPEVQANALNWAAEAKTTGEVQTGTRAVTLVEGLNLATSGVEEAAEAVRLHLGGVSMRAIAQSMGVGRTAVRRALVEASAIGEPE